MKYISGAFTKREEVPHGPGDPDFIQCHRNYQIFGRLASFALQKESPEALHKRRWRGRNILHGDFLQLQIRTAW